MRLYFAFSLLASSLTVAAPFGEQISESGIKHSFLVTGNKTAIIGEDCEVKWEHPKRSRDGEVASNGLILIAFADAVTVFNPHDNYEEAFHYKGIEGEEISTASFLPDGRIMIAIMGKEPRIIEIGKGGKRTTCPLEPESDNTHMQTRMARKLPNGNYLVPHLLAFAIKEYEPSGKVVRIIKTDLPELGGRAAENWPFTAITLENGHIMANLTHGNKTVIFDQEGKVQWVASGKRFADPCGGEVLPNGNIVICQYASKGDEMPDVIEMTPDKKVVWEFKAPGFRGAHQIDILTTNGEPVAGKR